MAATAGVAAGPSMTSTGSRLRAHVSRADRHDKTMPSTSDHYRQMGLTAEKSGFLRRTYQTQETQAYKSKIALLYRAKYGHEPQPLPGPSGSPSLTRVSTAPGGLSRRSAFAQETAPDRDTAPVAPAAALPAQSGPGDPLVGPATASLGFISPLARTFIGSHRDGATTQAPGAELYALHTARGAAPMAGAQAQPDSRYLTGRTRGASRGARATAGVDASGPASFGAGHFLHSDSRARGSLSQSQSQRSLSRALLQSSAGPGGTGQDRGPLAVTVGAASAQPGPHFGKSDFRRTELRHLAAYLANRASVKAAADTLAAHRTGTLAARASGSAEARRATRPRAGRTRKATSLLKVGEVEGMHNRRPEDMPPRAAGARLPRCIVPMGTTDDDLRAVELAKHLGALAVSGNTRVSLDGDSGDDAAREEARREVARRELANALVEHERQHLLAMQPRVEGRPRTPDREMTPRISQFVSRDVPQLNSCLQGLCLRCSHTFAEHSQTAVASHPGSQAAPSAAVSTARQPTTHAQTGRDASGVFVQSSPSVSGSASARAMTSRGAAAAAVASAVGRRTERASAGGPSGTLAGGSPLDGKGSVAGSATPIQSATPRVPVGANVPVANAAPLIGGAAVSATPPRPAQLFPPFVGEHYPADLVSSDHAVTGSWLSEGQGPPSRRIVGGEVKRVGGPAVESMVWQESWGACRRFVPGLLGVAPVLQEHNRDRLPQNRMLAFALDQDHTAKWPLFESLPWKRRDFVGEAPKVMR